MPIVDVQIVFISAAVLVSPDLDSYVTFNLQSTVLTPSLTGTSTFPVPSSPVSPPVKIYDFPVVSINSTAVRLPRGTAVTINWPIFAEPVFVDKPSVSAAYVLIDDAVEAWNHAKC